MRNPYQILGVSESASMDEIKKQYRHLSRIYHPDANVNNPNKDQAEAKFKEIQAAYQQIVNERERGSSGAYGSYGQGGTYGQGGYQQSYGGFEEFFGGFGAYGNAGGTRQETSRLQAAANYLRNGYYREALNVLNSMPPEERNGTWYYYSAQANSASGNNITALEHAQRAVQSEPDNYVYQDLLRRLQSGETWYAEQGSMYGRQMGGMSSYCCECLLLNLFCNCCCC